MLWMEEDEDCSYRVFVTKKEPRKGRKGRKRWEHDISGKEKGTTEGTEKRKRWEHDMSGEENGTTEGTEKTE